MSVKLLLGPILIGASLNTFLYGICASQFTTYYLSPRRREDSRATRYLVAYELVIDTFHSVASIYFLWLYMVDNFLNAAYLQAAPWPLTAVPLLTAMSACPIQAFLTRRVYQLSNSRYISALLLLLTFANAGLATTTSVLAFRVDTFDDGSRLKPVADAWLGLSVVNDLAITIFLVFYLNKSRTGLSKTDTVISRLIRSTIESAAFATFFAIMILITFTTLSTTGFHLLFSIPMGRIYTSTLLSTLNRRQSLRHDLSGTRDLGDLAFLSSTNGNKTAMLSVNVTKETEMNSLHKSPSPR
ncbi:hypothetical protein DFH09DRAFT_1184200 [Mycena vulgaris]|nr:hypothetical protein DFH09DRAFT_1184200 [Mycena vulgaris]